MDNICRLCLTDASNRDINTLSKEVLLKVSWCLGHDIIVVNNNLPQTICQLCWEKIEDIHVFRQKIIENQNILLKLLKIDDNSRNDNDTHDELDIKEEPKLENKENEIIQENAIVKLEHKARNVEIINPSKCNFSDNEEKFDSGNEDESLSSIKGIKDNDSENSLHKKDLKPVLNTEVTSQSGSYINFTCLTCFKNNKTQNELLKHYNEEHKSSELQEKNVHLENMYELVKVDGSSQYKCIKCEKVFDTKRKINRHMISHVEDRPFLCKLCGRTYKTASEIVRHGRAHNGMKVPCKYQCGYSTGYLGALKEHERRHRTEYMYNCEKCGKGFQVLTWYEQHQNIHTGLKPFVCEICGLAFHMDRYLKAHLTTVHPQVSSRKRFVCIHCSKPCDSKKSLTLHLKEHGITSKFLCDVCGKAMSDGSQLKFHKRMHLNDRPFSCSECGKSFARRSHLTLHSRTHSSQKEYECSRCERTYTQRATLRRHIRRFHNGILDAVDKEK